jgi:predicted aminopeptidase
MYALICRFLLWIIGWKPKERLPEHVKKYIVVVAPHTSNWDFMMGILSRPFINLKPGVVRFMGKSTLFKGTQGKLLKKLGGLPVDRSKVRTGKTSMVEQVGQIFDAHQEIGVAITPEGTRKRADKWRTGFWHLAKRTGAQVVLGYIDYHKRHVGAGEVIELTDDMNADVERIKAFYRDKYPRYREYSNLEHGPAKVRLWPNRIAMFLRIGLVVGVLWLLFNWQHVVYGIQQGVGQAKILLDSKPIDEYLSSETFPDSLKAKIRFIQEVKAYSVAEVGLDPSESYTKLYDQQGEPVLWVVTASAPYALEPKTWDYPLLGRMSYKGYFDKEKAIKLSADLEEENWDVRTGQVSAWSTLGFLSDPILSNMLYRSEGDLAELILHELTHGTLYVKNDVSYNENLASFIGVEGAKRFLADKYGPDSAELSFYLNNLQDDKLLARYVVSSSKKLDSLYKQMPESLPLLKKQELKQKNIQAIVDGLNALPFQNEWRPRFTKQLPNNAFFMAYLRYQEKQDAFSAEFEKEFNADLKSYIAHLKQEHPHIL